MSSLHTYLLGTPRFERNAESVTIGRRKVVALLALLAHSGQPHSREYLASLLWPEHDQSSALKNLRRDLGRLKEYVGGEVLEADRRQIGLNLQNGLEVDTAVFKDHLQTAADHSHPHPDLCAECLAGLSDAVALYSGDFMSGFTLADSAEFDEWQFFERETLRQKLSEALQRLIGWHAASGEFERGIEYGRRWLALDSLHEPAHRQLMQLYAWAGQHSAALRQYETCQQILEAELGVPPEPETDQLYDMIKRREQLPLPKAASPITGQLTPSLPASERFTVSEPLKDGGHAELFLGHDQVRDRQVVIKRIRPELIHDTDEYVTRFKREAEALRQLNHPNIVSMLDIFEKDGKQTIVMEYMPGGSLRDLLNDVDSLDVDQVLDIGLELADALSRAHHLDIIHRDLKPGNVLLAADGTPRLADFGIARLERDNIRLTPTGSILGSPAYMSPEALRGEELDSRSDIWSFGMILYEMLVGRRPFAGDQLTAVMISILNDPVPNIEAEMPDLPDGLAALLQQMLVKERDGRLSSMRLAAAELEAIRAGSWRASSVSYLPTEVEAKATLPIPATPFVGREAELDDICQLLTEQSDSRVITIVGFGGSGKTRLALAAAERVKEQFADGVYFVPLASLHSSEEIVNTVAEAMSVRLSGSDDPLQQLIRSLQDKHLLLVMDNFEHLLGDLSPLIELLQSAPQIKVLASSRERLQLAGEQVYGLHGLPVPDEATAVADQSHGAVTLFLQHVGLIRPSNVVQQAEWPDVVRICQLVQGMPLALVLAAGWADMLSFAEIGDEIAQSIDFLETDLQDLPSRQRSMRAVFDSSWQRLSKQEAAVLPKLALFSGGFTREAAQTICGANLRLLRQLINRSLITASQGNRYIMHELLRQYAVEKLPAAEQEPLNYQFAAFFSTFMVQQAHDIQRESFQTAIDQITLEQGNLTKAWGWLITAVTKNQPATVETLDLMSPYIEAWQFYYYLKGPMGTARELYTNAIKKMETAVATFAFEDSLLASTYKTIIANLQTKAAYFNFGMGNYQQVDKLLEQAIPWLKESKNDHLLCFGINCWGKASILRGQRDLAQEQLNEALAYAVKSGDHFIEADALKVLGVVAVDAGDYEEAHARYQESLTIFRRHNFSPGLAMLLHNIGTAYSRQGEVKLALAAYEEGLVHAKESRYERLVMELIGGIGGMYRTLGEFEKSERELKKSIHMGKLLGDKRVTASNMKGLGITYLEKGDVIKAKRMLISSLEVSWATETIPDALSILSAFARAIAQQGQLQQALEILLFVSTQKAARKIDLDNNQPIVDDLLAELPPEMVTNAENSAADTELSNLVGQLLV